MAADDAAQRVVEPHLVVEIIEAAGADIVTIERGLVDLGDKDDLLPTLDPRDDPLPELDGHHLGHVATEAVHAAGDPEAEDGQHLMPRVGHGIEILRATALQVDAVVELHRLIPVVAAGRGAEAVVTGDLSGKFAVLKVLLLGAEVEREGLSGQVVEVVVAGEGAAGVVVLTKVGLEGILGVGVVLTGHVVGHEVDEDLQPSLMRPLHEGLKLGHAVGHAHGQIGRHVVVILHGVGRSGLALNHGVVILGDAIGGVVRAGGML